MHCKLPPATPKCSLYAKTIKKTQIPVYDVLGPFPDEPLMSSIDRVLYLFGARRVQKYCNFKCSSGESDKSECSSVMKQKSLQNCSSDKYFLKTTPTYSVIQNCKCSKCDSDSNKSLNFQNSLPPGRQVNTPRVGIKENTCRHESARNGVPLRVLRRSFSLCSLACRKLKEKLSSLPTPKLTPQWLWTKVESYGDGCQVYEVFKNSNTTTHPTKFDTTKAAKIIFVVLPTGIIMPFETLPRH